MQLVIGISGKAGSGKTEVAKIIQKHYNSFILPFAKPLKKMAIDLGWDGRKDEKGRKFLQMLGTELGRAYNPNHWVDCWMADARSAANSGVTGFSGFSGSNYTKKYYNIIVADDCRFDNEAQAIHDLGDEIGNGINIHITGRHSDLGSNSNHSSENGISTKLIDYVIVNNQSLDHLEAEVLNIIKFQER